MLQSGRLASDGGESGEPKIGDVGFGVGVEEDVAGLQVSMDEPLGAEFVDVGHAFCDTFHDSEA